MTASLTKVAIFIIFSLSENFYLRMVGTVFANWVSGQGEAEFCRRILRVSVRERREIQAQLKVMRKVTK